MKILVSWLGRRDLEALKANQQGDGPLARGVLSRDFDRIQLLGDYDDAKCREYQKWLAAQIDATVNLEVVSLPNPMHFESIYEAAVTCVDKLRQTYGDELELTFHMSPGTPAMQSTWIILANWTYSGAKLIQSSKEAGVVDVHFPFALKVEYIGQALRERGKKITDLAAGKAPDTPAFQDIKHKTPIMADVLLRAHKAAESAAPVLILGEPGTGKELLARAIQAASPFAKKHFETVNCGAIPENLAESELFGHEKGAFTGATSLRKGLFERCDGGTVFLDEVGELSKPLQVKLLRVLQDGDLYRLGSSSPKKVQVRVIAATNRNLVQEIADGEFREDLFYRLAALRFTLPPLRQRVDDVELLAEHLLAQINAQQTQLTPGYQPKKLSVNALVALRKHRWPGNIRELQNTLYAAAVWAKSEILKADDIEAVLIQRGGKTEGILHRPLDNGINLKDILGSVAQHYLERAWEESVGNKTKAARLLGLGSYQTFDAWREKYGA